MENYYKAQLDILINYLDILVDKEDVFIKTEEVKNILDAIKGEYYE